MTTSESASHISHISIVVGVDGSPTSDLAVEWAARQAGLDHRTLMLVHAPDAAQRFWTGPVFVDTGALTESAGTAARVLLGQAAARADAAQPGLVVQQVLSESDPRQALLGLAGDACMIVVGSHGRGPVRSLLLGSVGVALTKLAPCPVVVVRSVEPTTAVPDLRHGVLVGVHSTDPRQPALEFAFDLASSRSWPLTVLQCSQDDDYERRNLAMTTALAGLEAKHPDVVVTRRMQHGFIDQCLVELSSSMHVVVVGSPPASRLSDMAWGSVASTVVEQANGVVVVVPPNDLPTARLSAP